MSEPEIIGAWVIKNVQGVSWLAHEIIDDSQRQYVTIDCDGLHISSATETTGHSVPLAVIDRLRALDSKA